MGLGQLRGPVCETPRARGLHQSDGYFRIGAVGVSVMGITALGDEKSERTTLAEGGLSMASG